jgi:hypothetical protein
MKVYELIELLDKLPHDIEVMLSVTKAHEVVHVAKVESNNTFYCVIRDHVINQPRNVVVGDIEYEIVMRKFVRSGNGE